MNKKKVCKRCRIFVDAGECPLCKGNQFATGWNGRVVILDTDHSLIAKKMGTTANGEYAIKLKV